MTSSSDHNFVQRYLKKESAYIALIILSMIGFAITDVSTWDSSIYWQAMVPIFCLTCIFTQWKQSERQGMPHLKLILTQVLHWGAFFMSMRLVYLPVVQQNISLPITGMIMVLLLALSTFLAGIYIGWQYCIVGLFLGVTVIAASFLEEITLFMMFVGLLLIVLSFFWARYRYMHRKKH